MPTRSLDKADELEVSGGHGKYTALGYRSARVATRDGRSYPAGSADLHLEYDRANLINQSRAFYRDNAIYRGIIDRAVSYIVGRGFGLRVLMPDRDMAQRIEAAWRKWHKRPDVRGLLTGSRAAAMVCREAMLCGDTGCIKRTEGLVQYIEAEQIATGNQVQTGIELDGDGKPVSYSVCPYGKQGRISPTSRQKIEAKDFLFFTTPGRPSQTRGEPILQSSFAMIHRINDVCDSEAVAWQMLSRLAISITRDQAETKAYGESVADPNKPAADSSADIASRLIELDYAIVFHGRPGDKAEGISRNIPGENFTESLSTFLRLLGLPIGMPLELILLDWSNANYSQSRAVLEQAYQTFCDWQQGEEDCYYQPLFEWRLPALLREADYGGDPAEVATEWIKPAFPWIDQLKEAMAHGVKIDRCLTTHAHVLKELNLDRDDVVMARQGEVIDAITRAKEIEAKTGVEVPWQLFCGLEVPKAVVEKSSDKTEDDTASDAQENKDG